MAPRQEMNKLPKGARTGFDEVALGYTWEQARAEAERCLQCRSPQCSKGCPVGVDIPAFLQAIVHGNIGRAYQILQDQNRLPAICGRVCPQETQCEGRCILAKKGEPVAVGALERYCADWARQHYNGILNRADSGQGKAGQKAAVVGSGPAGLTAAADLAVAGLEVPLFEALHAAGGVLRYGIPEFRLPKDIVDYEIGQIRDLGVSIQPNYLIGKTLDIPDLFSQGYGAVFIGAGAGLPNFLGLEGENFNGVYSANEFLTRVNLMKAFRFPEYDTPIRVGKRVAVIGAGNVAMDAARTAVRLGASEVSIVYRRSRAEMPARLEEIVNAEEEGIRFQLLTNPLEVLGDENYQVQGLRCQRMELGEPDGSGRRRPQPIPDSAFVLEVDTVVVAVGQGPNPILIRSNPNLQLDARGYIEVDPDTLMTNIPGVFAAGDIVTGAATVIAAMGEGRRAARSILEYLDCSS